MATKKKQEMDTNFIKRKLLTGDIEVKDISQDVVDGKYTFAGCELQKAIDNKIIFKYTRPSHVNVNPTINRSSPNPNDGTLTIEGGSVDMLALDTLFNPREYTFEKHYSYHQNSGSPVFFNFTMWKDASAEGPHLPIVFGNPNSQNCCDYNPTADSYATTDPITVGIGRAVEYNTCVNPTGFCPSSGTATGPFRMALDQGTVYDGDDTIEIKNKFTTKASLDAMVAAYEGETDFEASTMMKSYKKHAGSSGLTKGYRIPYSLECGKVKLQNIKDTVYFIYTAPGQATYETAEEMFASYVNLPNLLLNEELRMQDKIYTLETKVDDLTKSLENAIAHNHNMLRRMNPVLSAYNFMLKVFTCDNVRGPHQF